MVNLYAKILNVLLLLLIVACSIGCKKDKETPKTTYQIINNMVFENTGIEYLDGTMWEVVVNCNAKSNIVRRDTVNTIKSGDKTALIEVNPEYETVKISFRMLPVQSPLYSSPGNDRIYVLAYNVLKKGTNTVITIDGETLISKTLSSNQSKPGISQPFDYHASVNKLAEAINEKLKLRSINIHLDRILKVR